MIDIRAIVKDRRDPDLKKYYPIDEM